jgi:hypothetical protein
VSNIGLLYERSPIFGGFFNEWRVKRVNKLVTLLGADWFKDKKVLELGCAFGNVGFYLESLGAKVTFSDGRQESLDIVKLKDPSAKTILLDQDTNWNINETFDLIVHFGISYHLDNWQQDLVNAINHAQYVVYETAVNKFSNDIEFKIKDYKYSHKYHGPLNSLGSLPSVSMTEAIFKDKQVNYTRYDGEDLNHEGMLYNLKATKEYKPTSNDIIYLNSWHNPWGCGGRKYWLIKKDSK